LSDKKSQPQPTLAEMAEYLKAHETYRERYANPRFSWNIKVHDFDSTGKSGPDHPVQPKWDQRWDEFVQTDQYIFSQCCEDGMRHFFDTEYDSHYFSGVADDHPLAGLKSCRFHTAGRSGGHLILDALDGHAVDPIIDWDEQIEDDPTWLTMVYSACKDVDGFDPKVEMEYQYAGRRSSVEEEWDDEVKRAAQEKKDLKLIGTFIYLRAHPVKHRAVIEAAQRLSLPTTPDGEPTYDQ